jgi:Beta-ketoacyl synthase, N-terminal domain
MTVFATSATMVRGSSVTTGWGPGLQSLPVDARTAADGCRVVPIATPVCHDERLRRATRECVLAVVAVEQALANGTVTRSDLAGPRTALIYASASAYAAANWAFLVEDKEQTVFFPYTAASAVPGEVTIQFGITGPYLSLLSGANAGIEALWQAAMLLAGDQCDRALVLGVETFAACEDLFTAGRWLLDVPLVEAVTCLILERHPLLGEVDYSAGSSEDGLTMIDARLESQTTAAVSLCLPTAGDAHHIGQRLQDRWPDLPVTVVSNRVGTCLACTPLIGLLLSLAEARHEHVLLISRWWDVWSVLRWPLVADRFSSRSERKDG